MPMHPWGGPPEEDYVGKRVSAVAVLLATSFLGSLLALVLVGRNPLVGSSSDLVTTESLRRGVDGSLVSVEGSPESASPASSSGDGSVVTPEGDAVLDAIEVGAAEGEYRRGPSGPGGDAASVAAPQEAPPAEEDTANESFDAEGAAERTAGEDERAKDQGESSEEKAAATTEKASEKSKGEAEKASEKSEGQAEKASDKAKGQAEKASDKAKGSAEKGKSSAEKRKGD